jgi:VanZ family protein
MGRNAPGSISASPRLRVMSLWLPVLVWCGLIFYLSSIPNLRATDDWWDFPLRKAAHMTEFAILFLLTTRAFRGSTPWSVKRVWGAALLFCFLYACSDEFHQHFVVGRYGSPLDVLIDTVGSGLALFWLLRRSGTSPTRNLV